jgi:hypothetical protein
VKGAEGETRPSSSREYYAALKAPCYFDVSEFSQGFIRRISYTQLDGSAWNSQFSRSGVMGLRVPIRASREG